MPRYQYQIFIPGGNKTALVFGIGDLRTDPARRKAIQDAIIARHEQDPDGEVEQVGFVSTDPKAPELLMAGGEFCGNATRTAAAYYLDGSGGALEITVSGASEKLPAGGNESGEIWAEMPLLEDLKTAITPVSELGYWVEMEGISHLVVPELPAKPYLERIFASKNKEKRLEIALRLLEVAIAAHNLQAGDAYGVMFLENTPQGLKMHPFVHVKAADTTYYETGCGSGTTCVGLLKSYLSGESINMPILQPSDKAICAEIERSPSGKAKGKISGLVDRGEIYEIDVDMI